MSKKKATREKRGFSLVPSVMRLLEKRAKKRGVSVSRACEQAIEYAKAKGFRP